jgi:hypothetical protein
MGLPPRLDWTCSEWQGGAMSTVGKDHVRKEGLSTTRAVAAARLREIAEWVEGGSLETADGPITVPDGVYFELDVARKVKTENRIRFEIEAEIHWEERATPIGSA